MRILYLYDIDFNVGFLAKLGAYVVMVVELNEEDEGAPRCIGRW